MTDRYICGMMESFNGVFFSFFVFLGTKRSKQLAREKKKTLENTKKGDELRISKKIITRCDQELLLCHQELEMLLRNCETVT